MRAVSSPRFARSAYTAMSSYDGFMSCTLVTPSDAACSSARFTTRAAAAPAVIFGMTRVTNSIAASLSTPVGKPLASRTMRAAGGSGVLSVMPARPSAAEFASAMWPS